jgi:2-dehydropantoate 2-reductase
LIPTPASDASRKQALAIFLKKLRRGKVMKVCVYGAGAIGSYLAARLFKGGAQVSVVARGQNLGAIRKNGIIVKAPLCEIEARVDVTDDPATLGPQEIVVVAVKAPSLPSIARGLAALIGPTTSVVFVMNGIPWWYLHAHGGPLDGRRLPCIDHDDIMLETVGTERTMGGVIFGGCDVVEPGVVHVENPTMRLILGHPDGRMSAKLEAFASCLRGDDLNVEVTEQIRRGMWWKLQIVACSGLIGCLTDMAPKGAYAEPACEFGVRQLVDEVGAVANAMGYPTGLTAEKLLAMASSQKHKPSIAQDLASGRPIEFDAMFGVLLEFARLTQVPTPTFDLLTALVKLRATAAGSYSEKP